MLTAVPHGTSRNGFDLVDETGAAVATFRASARREQGEITSREGSWRFRRDGGRHFTLAGERGLLAEASKPGLWSGRWEVIVGSETYELSKRSWRSRAFELSGRSRLGEVRPQREFSRRAEVDLPPELPLPVQAFVVAVVRTLWRREQAAPTGTAATDGTAPGADDLPE